MGIMISNLMISWHLSETPFNIYGTKQNKKIRTNKFKNNQYYELMNDNKDLVEHNDDLEDQNDDILI